VLVAVGAPGGGSISRDRQAGVCGLLCLGAAPRAGSGELGSHTLLAKPLLPAQAEKRFYWRGCWQLEEQQNGFLWQVPRVAEGT